MWDRQTVRDEKRRVLGTTPHIRGTLRVWVTLQGLILEEDILGWHSLPHTSRKNRHHVQVVQPQRKNIHRTENTTGTVLYIIPSLQGGEEVPVGFSILM